MPDAATNLLETLSTPGANDNIPDVLGGMLAALEAPAAPAVAAPAAEATPPAAVDAPAITTLDPPPVEEQKSEEPDAVKDIPEELPGAGSDKAKADWKGVRERIKTEALRAAKAEKELAELKPVVEEARAKSAKLLELEEKAKGYDEAQQELSIARVEGTAEYKRTIKAPFEAITASLDAIATANNLKADDIFAAVLERDPVARRAAIEEIVTGLSITDQHEILQASKDAQVLLAKRDEIHANAAEARAELDRINGEKETLAQKQAREKYETSLKTTTDTFLKKIPLVPLKDGETAEAILARVFEQAKDIDMATADPGMQAYAAAAGFLMPRMVEQQRATEAKLKAAEARIAEIMAAKPTHGANGGPAALQSQSADSFLESMSKRLGVKI